MNAIRWQRPRQPSDGPDAPELVWSTAHAVNGSNSGARITCNGKPVPSDAEPAVTVECKNCLRKIGGRFGQAQATTARSRNVYQPYPPDYKPLCHPSQAIVITRVGGDSLTLATWSGPDRPWSGRQVPLALQAARERDAVLYAPTTEARNIRAVLQTCGIPAAMLASTRNGGCYITNKDDQPVGINGIPGFPPIWFVKPLSAGGLKPKHRAAEMFGFLEWAFLHGVGPDELGVMAFNLWKTTWPSFAPNGFATWSYADAHTPNRPPRETYVTGSGTERIVQLPLLGRDQAPILGRYEHATLHDKTMAYPDAMTHGGPFPWQLRHVDRPPRPGEVGISRITVHYVPDMAWSPLVTRDKTGKWRRWIHEPVSDLWAPNREVLLAQDFSVDLEVKETYVGTHDSDGVFREWFDLYFEARGLAYGAGIAKYVFTRLWGQLSRNDDFLPWSVEITARLRESVYREALGRPEVSAVYVETDGVITTDTPPQPQNSGPGSWRIKPKDGPVDAETWILGESTYTWEDPETGKPRYHAETSGVSRRSHCEQLGDSLFGNDPAWLARRRRIMTPKAER